LEFNLGGKMRKMPTKKELMVKVAEQAETIKKLEEQMYESIFTRFTNEQFQLGGVTICEQDSSKLWVENSDGECKEMQKSKLHDFLKSVFENN